MKDLETLFVPSKSSKSIVDNMPCLFQGHIVMNAMWDRFFKISCLRGKTCNFFLPKAVFFESCLIQNQVKFADTQFLFMLI